MGWPNKTVNRSKEKSYKEWLNSKKLEDKIEYKRNTQITKEKREEDKELPGTNLLQI
jgi:hypothetical protein